MVSAYVGIVTMSADLFGYADPLVEVEWMSVVSDSVASAAGVNDGT